MSPPRVVLVCPVGDEIGGAEQVMLTIARELPRHGFESTLLAMRPGRLMEFARAQGLEGDAFPIPHQYRDARTVWMAVRWLINQVRQRGPALIHSTHTAHLYAALASRSTSIREVWHLHDTPSPRDPVDRFQRLLAPHHSIATTRAVAAGFNELRRRPHTIIAPSCIEPENFRSKPPRPDLRTRLNLPAAAPILLTVTRLQSHKGHTDLIEAAAIVLRKRPDTCFVIVGKASTPEQEDYKATLIMQIERHGVNSAVRLIGYLDDADLAELYRQSAALIHPARSEGYGLVLLEAMAMNLPIIAAAASGPTEIIRDGVNGLLVPVRDPMAMANAIHRLLDTPGDRETLRDGGRKTVAESTAHSMIQKIVAVYRQVLDEPMPK